MIEDVKKIGKYSYLINDKVKITIREDGSVRAEFNDLSEAHVEALINEFFEKPVEKFY